jgi:hypothetical protein
MPPLLWNVNLPIDHGADQDFDDLVLELRKKQDPIIAIVQRPFATPAVPVTKLNVTIAV